MNERALMPRAPIRGFRPNLRGLRRRYAPSSRAAFVPGRRVYLPLFDLFIIGDAALKGSIIRKLLCGYRNGRPTLCRLLPLMGRFALEGARHVPRQQIVDMGTSAGNVLIQQAVLKHMKFGRSVRELILITITSC